MKPKPQRFLDKAKTFWSFAEAVDVRCPNCGGLGVVRRSADEVKRSYDFCCCPCAAFGGCREDAEADFAGFVNGDPPRWQGYPLYRVTRCRGHCLWALNRAHCAYLQDYVGATLRERVMVRPLKMGRITRILRVSNGSHVVSRLPRWMVLASARPAVLRGLAKLSAI